MTLLSVSACKGLVILATQGSAAGNSSLRFPSRSKYVFLLSLWRTLCKYDVVPWALVELTSSTRFRWRSRARAMIRWMYSFKMARDSSGLLPRWMYSFKMARDSSGLLPRWVAVVGGVSMYAYACILYACILTYATLSEDSNILFLEHEPSTNWTSWPVSTEMLQSCLYTLAHARAGIRWWVWFQYPRVRGNQRVRLMQSELSRYTHTFELPAA